VKLLRALLPVVLLAIGAARAADTPKPALDSIEQRVQACAACHGSEGRATREGYYPRIAGKPGGYLFNQLVNFRDGRRAYPMMVYLVGLQTDDYLRELADYFSAQRVPYAPPHPPTANSVALTRGRLLALEGDAERHIPSCRSCHGTQLLGVTPDVPGLLGVSVDYLISQLGAWRNGIRTARAPDCMAEITHRMGPDDVNAVTAWLAMQAVPEGGEPDSAFEHPPELKCGSLSSAGQQP
jgi:cytochrome c553